MIHRWLAYLRVRAWYWWTGTRTGEHRCLTLTTSKWKS